MYQTRKHSSSRAPLPLRAATAIVCALVTALAGGVVMTGALAGSPPALLPHNTAPVALGDRAHCASYTGIPPGWPTDRRAGMVLVSAGSFVPGSLRGYADERPAGRASVDAFFIDRTEVSNAQFAAFVRATGYRTEAERAGQAAVFVPPAGPVEEVAPLSWWRVTKGANWRHPEGPSSGLQGRANHPVVHVTLADAHAYARWLGHQLPTEAQWEFAARGARDDAPEDGRPRDAGGHPTANYWQGEFPVQNRREDGFVARAPVGCFPANALGLHDVIGNVWEWTADVYQDRGVAQAALPGGKGACHVAPGSAPADAQPGRASVANVNAATPVTPVVIKGGSFLCSPDFCARYRATARHPQEAGLATAHIGFRTVMPARDRSD